MAKLGYCKIDNLKLSIKSRSSVHSVKELMQSGGLFSGVVAMLPVIQVFNAGSPLETAITIREYDWDEFEEAMHATAKITRKRIYIVAEPMTWQTTGQEQKFWRCVSDATF